MTSASATRHVTLSQALPASVGEAWGVLTDLDGWSRWGRLVTAARGELVPGAVWTMSLRTDVGRGPRRMTPRLLRADPPDFLEFETVVGAAWLVRMTHGFHLDPTGPRSCVLRQEFEATGVLVGPLWRWLEPGMRQFDALGEDLARALGEG